MGVDAAGRHHAVPGIDFVRRGWQPIGDGDYPSPANADIGMKALAGRDDVCVADYQVEVVHTLAHSVWNRRPHRVILRVSAPSMRSDFQSTVAMVS